VKRRDFVAGAAGALVLSSGAHAQLGIAPANTLDPLIWVVTKGEVIRRGRVTLEMPQLADNGNSVAMRVVVESPMSATEYVKAIHLFSDRNPQRNMAVFYLGPRAGRAEIVSRVRLAGSQRVTALAEMSDGTFWSGFCDVIVTLSACIDSLD
jgi:sulfur-oxidizing protein SoxY